jgi:hypothetical protein
MNERRIARFQRVSPSISGDPTFVAWLRRPAGVQDLARSFGKQLA